MQGCLGYSLRVLVDRTDYYAIHFYPLSHSSSND